MNSALDYLAQATKLVGPTIVEGKITEVSLTSLKAKLPGAKLGEIVDILDQDMEPRSRAVVVKAFHDEAVLAPFSPSDEMYPGQLVHSQQCQPRLSISPLLLGCVLDSQGKTLSRLSEPDEQFRNLPPTFTSARNCPPPALSRNPIERPYFSGVRAIDTFCTLAEGSRIAVISEAGVGKSSLLGMLAANSSASINVIGLIGERGREVGDFLRESLSPSAKRRTIVVASTSDETPISRIMAAQTATRIAEYFADHGSSVLLQIDSLTRLFRAYRDLGLATGELPVRQGYTPSVFSEAPKLIERAGPREHGAITAIYTILRTDELNDDPMVEEVKGLLDGHILLSRKLAAEGHYPAIDLVRSISRLQNKVLPREQLQMAQALKAAWCAYCMEADSIAFGAEPSIQAEAIVKNLDSFLAYLQQTRDEEFSPTDFPEALTELHQSVLGKVQ